ncbi:unnamed protein product [Brassica rapa subsp. trilocularis]
MLFLMYIISTGHESSGLTIIWASISLQEHPKILQKLEAYIIPKGWKVMTWFIVTEHDKFILQGYRPIPVTFLHFHLGSGLCPEKNLAKLEIPIFLHL